MYTNNETYFDEQRYCSRGTRYLPQKSTNLMCSIRLSKKTPGKKDQPIIETSLYGNIIGKRRSFRPLTRALGVDTAMGATQIVGQRHRNVVGSILNGCGTNRSGGQLKQRRRIQRDILHESHDQRIFTQRQLYKKIRIISMDTMNSFNPIQKKKILPQPDSLTK